MKTTRFFLFFTAILFSRFATAQTDHLASIKKLPDHPRILLLKGEENAIKRAIGGDKTRAQLQQTILVEADVMLDLPPVERIKTGRRLLEKSREALRRLFFLSYAWRMTNQDKYQKRAEKELLAVSAFSDWNPTHFLDVGE
ncbi:MAG: heparinase, partial [Bacteroidetes bacterium]|nr:heparinase [Fibrella sp.]